MPPPIDLATLDFAHPVADRDAIRKLNPQRFEMEQLTAIVHLDPATHTCVGYKDVTADEFWVRGHMPGNPLLPGVLMCEAAAQLCSYYTMDRGILAPGHFVGFGGLEEVRFRGAVRPGDRLVLVSVGQRVDRRQSRFAVTGYVGDAKVFEAIVIGVPLPIPTGA